MALFSFHDDFIDYRVSHMATPKEPPLYTLHIKTLQSAYISKETVDFVTCEFTCENVNVRVYVFTAQGQESYFSPYSLHAGLKLDSCPFLLSVVFLFMCIFIKQQDVNIGPLEMDGARRVIVLTLSITQTAL